MTFLDYFLSDFNWWRRKRPGVWFHVRELGHPQIEYWTRKEPLEEDSWVEVIERRSYK